MKDHKLAAIVFTDIVGYTKRMEVDEEGTMKLLSRQREILFPLVKDFGGEVIKEIGDGLLMMFTSANRAVRFTIAVQDKLKDDELTIRAGIHIGDVIFKEGDVYGSAVNIAARIEPLAPAGGICISEDVRSQIRNQSDIITISIGEKELKGVYESIEIFSVVSEEASYTQSKISFYKDLWQRRVFQITGIYLIISYLLKLSMGYFANEYMLSPHLTSLVWYILLSLTPSIILISYFHGKKEVSKWKRVELIGLPLNVVLASLILILVFKGKDLGAITTTLTVQNEDGVKIEKIIAKNQFRKKILIFNLKNISNDTALDHLQYGIPAMTEHDLSQDLFITPINSMDIYSRITESGYKSAIGLPITLMQRFAKQLYTNYFMCGNLDKENGEYLIDVKLYDTKYTRLVSEITVRNESPFILVDHLSLELKKAMELPESHISETVDLPVSEIFTDSTKALQYFSMSILEDASNNWNENVRLLNMAIKEDPKFALAYVTITMAYFNISDLQGTMDALDKAMELLYKLPERHQFIVKYVHYVFGQQPDKALNIVKMWAELYPDDIVAHQTLVQRYALKNMLSEAINECKAILELDPEQYNILIALGDFYKQIGKFDSSLIYYQEYAKLLPQQALSYRNLGNYYEFIGDMESARKNYEKALLLADASEEVSLSLELANIIMDAGDFDQAFKKFEDVFSISRSARDSGRVYSALEDYYLIKGQVGRSLKSYELKMEKYKSFMNPKDYLISNALNLDPYIHAGKFNKAVEILEKTATILEPPLDKVIAFGYMFIYTENGDVKKAREAISGAEELIKGFGQEALMASIYYSEGDLCKLEGDYQKAIDHYNTVLEMSPSSQGLHVDIASCYRLLGDYKNAEKEIKVALKYAPFGPITNYEAALIYFDKGKNKKGLEHLQKAVDIWKDADSDYEKANVAKEKLISIKSEQGL